MESVSLLEVLTSGLLGKSARFAPVHSDDQGRFALQGVGGMGRSPPAVPLALSWPGTERTAPVAAGLYDLGIREDARHSLPVRRIPVPTPAGRGLVPVAG